ncbi:uncharacterized protein [Magallana gigas]|uniref:uncharacterized protein n=1 Tax=Magallana gigas TaxID=29159 RepID=UPI003342B228
MTTRKDTWDPLTKSLIDQTEWQLSQKLGNPCYTELPVLDDVIKRVLETGIVVITGKAGDGKTTLGLSVLRHFHNVCYSTPINLLNSNPHELHKILMTDKNCVLLMDDIFGKTNFEIKRFERWQPMLEELHSYKGFGNPDMRSVFIVITLRSNIYFESLRYLRSVKFSEHNIFATPYLVDLADGYRMDRLSKLEMIDNYSSCYQKTLSNQLRREISKTETPLGFPHLCKLFFKDISFFQKGLHFFEYPFELLVEHVKEMFDLHYDKFVTLCAVLLFSKDSCLPFQCVINKIEDLGELLAKFGQNAPNFEKLKINLKLLQGAFLSFDPSSSTYEFSHISIRETVFIVAGEKFIDVVLNRCKNSDLDLVCCDFSLTDKDSSTRVNKLVLRKEQYPNLFEKMYDEILQNPYESANLKIMHDKRFVNSLVLYYKQKSCMQYLIKKRYRSSDALRLVSRYQVDIGDHCPSLVLFCYRNPMLLSQIIDWYDSTNSWFRRERKFTLALAMGSDCPQVVEIIIHYGTVHDLPEHPFTQSVQIRTHPKYNRNPSQIDDLSFELVDYLSRKAQLSITKTNRHTDTVDEELLEYSKKLRIFERWPREKVEIAMEEACKQDNLGVFKFLLQNYNVDIKESHFRILIEADDECSRILEYALTVKLFTNAQNILALDTACRHGNYSLAKLLVADGTPIEDDVLQLVAGLTNANQDLIDLIFSSREWSSSLTEFALQTAFMKGNVEVASFLVEKGTRLTENCLVFAAYSPKAIPLFSILALVNDSSWSNEAVNKAIEIACMKHDFLLLECILSIKRTDQALAIASDFPENYKSEQILQNLLEQYHWTVEERRLAVSAACDKMNIAMFKLLKNHDS